jgi:hypothetical protein
MTKKIVTMAEVAEQNGFLRKRGAWSSLTKRAVKSIVASMDVMEAVLETSQDDKLKANTANQLATLSMNILEADNRDELTRLISQSKFGGGLLGGSTAEDENQSPLIDFENIQSC